MRLRIAAITAAALLAGAWIASGAMVSYSVEGFGPQQFPGSLTPPADAPWGANGYPGDTVELQTYTGSFDLVPGTSMQKINTLLWTIDYTYGGTPEPWPDMNFAINANRKMSIDGGLAIVLNQAGNLRVNYENDYLGFDAGATVTFFVAGYQVDVTPMVLATVGGSNFDGSNPWIQLERDVTARFDITAVPEPSTFVAGALLALPFGLQGIRFLRTRKLVS